MTNSDAGNSRYGKLALVYCDRLLAVQVLRSRAGFYIGTADPDGPVSRESVEYFPTHDAAEHALAQELWTQKQWP